MGVLARIACSALLLGCGYHLLDARGPFGPEIGRIEIRPLENHSNQPGLERLISDALVEEIDRRGSFRPVYGLEPGQPGLVLRGAVRDFELAPVAFSSAGLALEHEIGRLVGLDLVRSDTGAAVWNDRHFKLTERFLGSADVGVHESNQEDALLRMATELAGRVHDALLQAF